MTTAPTRPTRTPPRLHEDVAETPTARRVKTVHRIGAFTVAAVLAVFGVLGFVGGLDYFSTDGGQVAGLSSNGLLSTISLVTAAVLVAGAVKGGRIAGIVMTGVGTAFLLSAFWHLFVLNTGLNVLAFQMSNVIFSIVVGLLLLTLGLYGRVSGNLPADNPYRANLVTGAPADDEEPDLPARTPEERRAEAAIREAEVAVAEHRATPEQAARVEAMSHERTKAGRRRVWMQYS
ncbi:DUF4383 domain-containing protein [Klenkia taihuensis]|uniref:DUF4383 domain-containing protein n=1 Tax=Klenkia taihuensis TaxID=1225127 RepID=A0A1I1P1K6_9ACTN|nr:DUF4383 domain-containing protein [Klenkia taihuensis]GHE11502.1 hypothetical protein GCM10011381_25200 [Klenkia taihuensis]SFD03811.1 protein of unknown function [Klenkia taihuensis]